MNKFRERYSELEIEIEQHYEIMNYFKANDLNSMVSMVQKRIDTKRFIQSYCLTLAEKTEQSGNRVIIQSKI